MHTSCNARIRSVILFLKPDLPDINGNSLSCLTFIYAYEAKPQVLLVGQYSVGKTSFIRYLLGQDFPGQRIGPEPTTDRFTGKFTKCPLHMPYMHIV
jgi:hypothetical protein